MALREVHAVKGLHFRKALNEIGMRKLVTFSDVPFLCLNRAVFTMAHGVDPNTTFGMTLGHLAESSVGQFCWDAALSLPAWIFYVLKICVTELLQVRTFGILVLLLFAVIIVLQVARTFYMKSTMRTTTLMSGSNFSVRRFRKRDKLRYYYERTFRNLRRRLREKAAGRSAEANITGDGTTANTGRCVRPRSGFSVALSQL